MTKSPGTEYARAAKAAAWAVRPDLAVVSAGGADRTRFLQGMISNDVNTLSEGRRMEAAMLTVKGKLTAVMAVYNTGPEFWLEIDRAVLPTVLSTLEKYVIAEDVTLKERSDLRVFTLLGPKSREAVPDLPGENEFKPVSVAGAAGYAAASSDLFNPAFQIFLPHDAPGLAGVAEEIHAETLEVLRMEAGIPKWGVDVNEENLLMEISSLERAVSYTKGCYIGQETVARLHARGGHVAKRLMGLAVTGTAPVPAGAQVFHAGKEAGHVSSVCFSPKLGGPLALAMIHRDAFAPGNSVEIRSGAQIFSATVISLPL